MHLHQHTRAASARKSANMVSVALNAIEPREQLLGAVVGVHEDLLYIYSVCLCCYVLLI